MGLICSPNEKYNLLFAANYFLFHKILDFFGIFRIFVGSSQIKSIDSNPLGLRYKV